MNFDIRQQQLSSADNFFVKKNYTAKFEDVTKSGQFSGYASVYNNVDHDGDVILPQSFNKSLQSKIKEEIKLLWQHNISQPIGKLVHIAEDDYGLYIRGQLLLDLPQAREAYSMIKDEIITSFSVGFFIQDYDHKHGFRRIKQADLMEVSLVTFPANPLAKITDYKSSAAMEELQNAIQRGLSVLG